MGRAFAAGAAALICTFALAAFAGRGAQAEELQADISLSSGRGCAEMTDDDIYTSVSLSGSEQIRISCEEEIGGVYIMWNKIPGEWTYACAGTEYTGGEDRFLHEYVELGQPTDELVLRMPQGGAQITDIYVFGRGEPPDWVQRWRPSCEEADILLFSTHADDEHLFFAGLLPYYASVRGAEVQVAYLTQHWSTASRPHEQLDGLWAVGIRNYPVIADFPDDGRSFGSASEKTEDILARARRVYDEEEWIEFQTEQIRRFKPLVIVGHDLNGEYGHGAHMLNAAALAQAVQKAADADYAPESAEKYGVWDTPKTYLHLYEQNQITIDYDTPYQSLGGMTPFEVSKLGYARHLSQQWTWFTDWMDEPRAADIETYSPCRFGLYRSTVGPDVYQNDLLENIVPRGSAELPQTEQPQTTPPQTQPAQTAGPGAQEPQTEPENRTAAIVLAAAIAAGAAAAAAISLKRKKTRSRQDEKKEPGK